MIYNYLGGLLRPIFILVLFILVSCAQNTKEKVDAAIDVALTHLSKYECDEAISVLNDAGNDNSNAIYLQVLASAYACKASFNEVSFLADDLPSLDASSPANIFKSFSSMSLSTETVVDSDEYVSIRQGISVLLNSSSGAPSQVNRTTKFGARKSGDMGVQALVLSVVNLGKFLHYYGNTSSSGVKGGGPKTNTCFINYTDTRARAAVTSGAGACTVFNNGHADLAFTAGNLPAAKRRLCEGLMLMTNVLDIMDNLDLSDAGALSKLSDIADQVETFKTLANAAGLGTLINMTSQSACETALNTQSNLDDMELMYSIMFEKSLL